MSPSYPNPVAYATLDTAKCRPPGNLGPTSGPHRTGPLWSALARRIYPTSYCEAQVFSEPAGFDAGSCFTLVFQPLSDPPLTLFFPYPVADFFDFVCVSDIFLEQISDFSTIYSRKDRLLDVGKNPQVLDSQRLVLESFGFYLIFGNSLVFSILYYFEILFYLMTILDPFQIKLCKFGLYLRL